MCVYVCINLFVCVNIYNLCWIIATKGNVTSCSWAVTSALSMSCQQIVCYLYIFQFLTWETGKGLWQFSTVKSKIRFITILVMLAKTKKKPETKWTKMSFVNCLEECFYLWSELNLDDFPVWLIWTPPLKSNF